MAFSRKEKLFYPAGLWPVRIGMYPEKELTRKRVKAVCCQEINHRPRYSHPKIIIQIETNPFPGDFLKVRGECLMRSCEKHRKVPFLAESWENGGFWQWFFP